MARPAIWDRTFETVDAAQVHEVLKARRFAILQGPPGTGKTRLAEQIQRDFFDGRGITVQFHPAVTYEDFLGGSDEDVRAEWVAGEVVVMSPASIRHQDLSDFLAFLMRAFGVANGSRLPVWPALRAWKIPRTFCRARLDDMPTGLSSSMTP